jgi:AcrR family transcriptional regulator
MMPHRRNIPTQARSAATYEKILASATEVLVEDGLNGFNTNAVAERAGVNVGSVYHYFANKNDLLKEMYLVDQGRRNDYVYARFVELPASEDMAEFVAETTRNLIRLRREHPESITLRRACRAVPELVDLERTDAVVYVANLSAALRKRYPHLSKTRAAAAAWVVAQAGSSLLDAQLSEPTLGRVFNHELNIALTAYFQTLET